MYFPPADPPATLAPVVPGERVGAIIEIILCSGLPTQLLLIGVLYTFGMAPAGADGGLNPPFVFTVSLLDAVFVVGLVVLFLRAHHESVRDVLIGHGRLLREMLFGIAMIPLVFLVVILVLGAVLTYAPHLHNVVRNPLEDMLRNNTDAAIFAVVAMIAGAYAKRCSAASSSIASASIWAAAFGVLLYSVIFGLGHYEQGYDAALATAALGAFWGLVYLRRRSIVAPVISHAGFNLAQVIKHVTLR